MSNATAYAPFLEVRSFQLENELHEAQPETFLPTVQAFLSVYAQEGFSEAYNPHSEAYLTFLSEIYDEEFDESLYELVNEASRLCREQSQYEFNTEAVLERHFAPLITEAEKMFEAFSQGFGELSPLGVTETEAEQSIDNYTLSNSYSPEFEDFLGKLKKLAKKAVKGATDLAKKGIAMAGKYALGPLLNRLKAFIRPLLERVIKMAIGKLPPNLQPIAQKLADKLPFLKELEMEEPEFESPANRDVSSLQHEFNYQVANVLFAADEVDLELEMAYSRAGSSYAGESMDETLDVARERFIRELSNLREGESPAPLIENFLPALMPVLKLGLKLSGGRTKLIALLAPMLAKLIERFVGPQYTPPLSQAIVSAGLGLLGLEASPENEKLAAHTAVASTVEETVQRIANLPEEVLGSPELLEAYALEAFEQAAADNLPPVLPDAVYQQRPELRAAKAKGMWLFKRLRGNKGFKKFSRKFAKQLSAHDVAAIQTFGGDTLSEYFQEQLGLPAGVEVEVELELFECPAGVSLNEMAQAEFGNASAETMAQMHPLTPEAAAMLLGETNLGKPLPDKAMSSPMGLKAGNRVYQMKVAGKRPLMTGEPGKKAKVRRRSRITLTLDFPRNRVHMCVFLSEVAAQKLAPKLRGKAHLGMIVNGLQGFMERKLPVVLSGKFQKRIRVIHEAVTPDQALGPVLARLPPTVTAGVAKHLRLWVMRPLTEFLRGNATQFVAATEDTLDGVSLCFTLTNPPGFPAIRQMLRGKAPSLANFSFAGEPPAVKIHVAPGFHSAGHTHA